MMPRLPSPQCGWPRQCDLYTSTTALRRTGQARPTPTASPPWPPPLSPLTPIPTTAHSPSLHTHHTSPTPPFPPRAPPPAPSRDVHLSCPVSTGTQTQTAGTTRAAGALPLPRPATPGRCPGKAAGTGAPHGPARRGRRRGRRAPRQATRRRRRRQRRRRHRPTRRPWRSKKNRERTRGGRCRPDLCRSSATAEPFTSRAANAQKRGKSVQHRRRLRPTGGNGRDLHSLRPTQHPPPPQTNNGL